MNRTLHNEGGIAADCEIGWLEDHEPNDFACVLRDALWKSSTREGELFRIEAKSMHIARGSSFVQGGMCPDGCRTNPCAHTGEPLNAAGKRERKGGPDSTRPSEKVAFANNFGGLVRMLKTDNAHARRIFKQARAANPVAHEYISFIHRNFPSEEIHQYTIADWRALAAHAHLSGQGKPAEEIREELRATTPDYQSLLRDFFAAY